MSKKYTCAACGAELDGDDILKYTSMPSVAQYLPDEKSLAEDSGVDLNICQCKKCSLIQLRCEPVPYFREVIRASGVSREMADFRHAQFSDFINRHALSGKKILECGCGGGEYLSIMRDAGAIPFGMEYSGHNIEQCRKAGLNVERSYFETGAERLADAPFDAFCMFNILEHIPDLRKYLEGIYGNLKPGAAGLLEVPDFDMMLKNNTFAEFMRDHLSYFTRKSLSNLLENNGFDIVSMKNIFHHYILSAEVVKRTPVELSGFEQARERLCGELRELVMKYGKEKSAVWGASHQAFAILALAGLQEGVRCIIDSAGFKHNKFSPVTHIKIVPPDSIEKNALSLLIVMAGGYSSEVARIAGERFGNMLDIYILRENKLEYYK